MPKAYVTCAHVISLKQNVDVGCFKVKQTTLAWRDDMGKAKAAKAKSKVAKSTSKIEDTLALLKAQAEELRQKGWAALAEKTEKIASGVAKRAAKHASKAQPDTPANG